MKKEEESKVNPNDPSVVAQEAAAQARLPEINLANEIMQKATGSVTEAPVASDATAQNTAFSSTVLYKKKIGEEDILKAEEILKNYKAGKENLEAKLIENEQFWKLRHWESKKVNKDRPATAWLWNVIVSKHADMEDAYPEPSFLARAKDDEPEAKKLSSVVPVILAQNNFEETYSDCAWYKLKQGASVYGCFWDGSKMNGLGDISINKIDLINLFWESGITDIQKSRHVFHVELVDNEIIEQRFPETKGKLGNGNPGVLAKYLYDENVDTSEKSCVVDWYYHTEYNGMKQLHLVKYVSNILLFASENDPENYPNGWYAHGQYPFVVDSLYDIEGSICGYSYTDICKDAQIQIDTITDALVKNTILASKPRFMYRADSGLNIEEFANLNNEFIKVEGNLGEDALREVKIDAVSGNCMNMLQLKIDEIKDTTGNKEVNNGSTPSGVTAASAIAALQEAAGKTSRDVIKTTYKAYKQLIYMVIELIRENYSIQREFRITGEQGQNEYIDYSNANIAPQAQGTDFGVDMGYRLPMFDITVSAAKANPYSRMEQNELAIQLYNMGFFNPQMSDQALACLEAMDFETKEKIKEIIGRNATMYDKLMLFAQLSITLALKYEPQTAMQLQQQLQQLGMQLPVSMGTAGSMPIGEIKEHATVEKARQKAAQSTQPR